MKQRTYQKNQRPFCPHCHKEVNNPMKNVNLKGSLRLQCPCRGGVVIIKGE